MKISLLIPNIVLIGFKFPVTFLVLSCWMWCSHLSASNTSVLVNEEWTSDECAELQITESNGVFVNGKVRPNPILQLFKIKHKKNKRITAAVLAFPFPFGIVGLHRIYLGTSPHVPVVYIGTAGGVLGILPFIDFCVLLLDKDIDRYIENKKVFMWVN